VLRADGALYPEIRESGDLTDETEEKLRAALDHFAGVFNVEEERGLAG
jgi:hypothetical protein